MDCSSPGTSVHGISLARTLKWIAMLSSRGSSWPRDQTQVSWDSCTASGLFTAEPSGKPKITYTSIKKKKKSLEETAKKKKRNWLSWLERFKKPHDLQSGSWRPRRANDVITVQKPADLRLRKSQCISSHLKAIITNVPAQRCQTGGVPLTHRKISGFCSIHAFTWLNEAHHIANIYLLYLDFQFKC